MPDPKELTFSDVPCTIGEYRWIMEFREAQNVASCIKFMASRANVTEGIIEGFDMDQIGELMELCLKNFEIPEKLKTLHLDDVNLDPKT